MQISRPDIRTAIFSLFRLKISARRAMNNFGQFSVIAISSSREHKYMNLGNGIWHRSGSWRRLLRSWICKVKLYHDLRTCYTLEQRSSGIDMAYRDSRSDVLQPNSSLPWGILLHYRNLLSAKKLISELSGSYVIDKESERCGRMFLNALDLPKGGGDLAPMPGYQ